MYLSCMLILGSCMTYAEPTQSSRWIMASEGGGFTGFFTSYYLLPNGQVFRIESRDSQYQELQGIRRREAREQFRNIGKVFDAYSGEMQDPGNIYKTMGFHNGKQTRYLSWVFSHGKSAAADEFYRNLLLIISQENRTGVAP